MTKGEIKLRVRYQETDQMGVVYYANYFVWFEVGRTEFFRKLSMPYSEFEKNSLFLPVIKAYCEYKSPARYDDEITVVTRMEELQEVRIAFQYNIFRDRELLATGTTEHAFVNQQGRPVVLRKQNPFLWRRLYDTINGSGT